MVRPTGPIGNPMLRPRMAGGPMMRPPIGGFVRPMVQRMPQNEEIKQTELSEKRELEIENKTPVVKDET